MNEDVKGFGQCSEGCWTRLLVCRFHGDLNVLQTELVEGEEHDHTITSRINLVDLAGSERCASAQTSGERLRVNVHTAGLVFLPPE